MTVHLLTASGHLRKFDNAWLATDNLAMRLNKINVFGLFIYFLFLPLEGFSNPQMEVSQFLTSAELETEFKSYCLKMQTSNSTPTSAAIDRTSRQSQGIRFESIRFGVSKPGIDQQTACKAEREIIQLIKTDGQRQTLSDSGFYPEAYCEQPMRYSQPPIVYEMTDLFGDEKKSKKQKLAVIEFFSSTLPCPDVDEISFRRFVIFDLENLNQPLLDIRADSIVAEIGNSPYRIHLKNVTEIFKSSVDKPQNRLPVAIELQNGKLIIRWTPIKKLTAPNKVPSPREDQARVQLNSIYSKDQKHVYYDTGDTSGVIKDADPKSFQLLNPDDESAYTKDAGRVYFFGKAIPHADPKTFVQLNERYGKDVKNVYHMDLVLSEADVSSFVAPFKDVWYAKDANHVFSGRKIFKLADPQTFSIGDDRSCGTGCTYRSEDKNYRFDSNGQIVQRTAPPK